MNEDSATGGGTGTTTQFRLLLQTNISGAKVQLSGPDETWYNTTQEIYRPKGTYTLQFSEVLGYITPQPITFDLDFNKLLNVVYVPKKYPVYFDVNIPGQKVRVIAPNETIDDT
jgi:hypothetical protein